MNRPEMLQVGIPQDWQLSAPGPTREPELPVLVHFVQGKDEGRQREGRDHPCTLLEHWEGN